MFKHSLSRSVLVFLGIAMSGSALAQSGACQRYRAELASLGSGGGGGFEAAAQRQRYEISRLAGYYQSLGCNGGGGFFMFGEPPAECAAIGQRIRLMQATYNQLAARSDSGASPARRNQLVAAVREACRPQTVALQEPSRAAEKLYAERRRQDAERRAQAKSEARSEDSDRKAPTGGGRVVCVKTCDGSFFPMENSPDGRGGADQMCKALCPGAETVAYSMPSDGEIEQAVSLAKRKPYVQLAAAFKFQKSVDASCACRKPGETWAQALQRAEKMIARSGDIIVTAKKAEELSRPKSIRVASRNAKPAEAGPRETYASIKPEPAAADAKTEVTAAVASKVAVQKADVKPEVDIDATGSLKVPTASNASSGIGEQVAQAKPLAQGDGPKIELKEGDGAVRKVRVVAPGVIPVPKVEAR
jgi:hypothetical protein